MVGERHCPPVQSSSIARSLPWPPHGSATVSAIAAPQSKAGLGIKFIDKGAQLLPDCHARPLSDKQLSYAAGRCDAFADPVPRWSDELEEAAVCLG